MRAELSVDFTTAPPNLTHPSCFRIIFDSVTLQKGTTVLVLLVAWTDGTGSNQMEVLGMPCRGAVGRREDHRQLILAELNMTLTVLQEGGDMPGFSGPAPV